MVPSFVQNPTVQILTAPEWKDYELLDSGNGRKLERFGHYRLVRPEAEAIWKPALNASIWEAADAFFKPSPEENGGHWILKNPLPGSWSIGYNGLKFSLQTTASRHLGVFPEQASHWDWMETRIMQSTRPLKVLNLFGYTGLASLAAARAGAQVTHVDASKKVVTWAHENLILSGLEDKPVRWLVDDAIKFVEREVRRGAGYDGIILDPPKFGRGPKGEVWEFYRLIPELLHGCHQILNDRPSFIVVTAYAVKASCLTLFYTVEELMQKNRGQTEVGELAIKESSAGRLLSTAIFARWSAVLPEKNINRGSK